LIDNSSSMGDKQQYLAEAIPDLVDRFVNPRCVDPAHPRTVVGKSTNGACTNGRPEFPPVHDMHVGVLSSSLGPRLGTACGSLDDRAELLTRGASAPTVQDAQASGYLAWFPKVDANNGKPVPANAIQSDTQLQADFKDLVAGTGQSGCGIESQLETWYRFLVQPDPYDHLDNPNGVAQWVGVDTTILKQRHDFLRPDSLVAVVVLSDENDSEVDVRAIDGQAWQWLSADFHPPRGTAICATKPNDPACTTCAALSPADRANDPSCKLGDYTAYNDWGYDLNLRHVHMRQKYGVDVQFPIGRYVVGLTSGTVPNRDGEYPAGAHNYVGNPKCTNPLFASKLPDGSDTGANTLCDLPRGHRTSDMIFYAHIGGVPHELLHYVPGDANASALSDADWTKILGHDPEHGDYAGIDPHMIESYAPRPGLPPPQSKNDADPIHGREWITDTDGHVALSGLAVDRQYACTFALKTPRDCTRPENQDSCDCRSSTLTHDGLPPVCDETTPTLQTRAKAYPTTRELLLAKKLGAQGLVSSICPIHTSEETPGDPLYGYRPAVASIVDRLGQLLGAQCIPRALTTDPDTGKVPCRVLAALPDSNAACDPKHGLAPADATDAKGYRDELVREGSDVANGTICEVVQLTGASLSNGTCALSTTPGWCYVSGEAAAPCAQTLTFSSTATLPNRAQVRMVCLESQAAK
jgi:hypothetical protein